MFYLLSTLWILSITALLVILTNKKFEVVLPFSFICGTLILYLFGFINRISWGYYLTWLLSIGTIVYILYKTIKDKSFIKGLKDKYLTLGLFVFIILLVYVFVLYRYQGFSYCDEFMHWGPMVKETIRLDGFYAQTSSLLEVHKDYPPFFSLLETMFCFFGNGYKESYLYVGLITFMFSLFMPLFRKLDIRNKKDYLKALLMLIGIVLIGLTISRTETASDYAHVYNSIYVDWALSVLTAFTFYLIFIEKERNIVSTIFVSLCFITLVLAKQMGMAFYLLTFMFAVIKLIFVDKKKISWKYLLFFIVIPVVAYFSWTFVKEYYQIKGQFNVGEIGIGNLVNIIKGNIDSNIMYKHDVAINFISQLLHRPLVLHPLKITYFVYILIQVLLIIIIQRKKGILISVIYVLGSIAYAFAMMLLYIFSFTIDEATILASFDRYMMAYLYIGNILVLMIAYETIDIYWRYLIVLAIIILSLETKSIKNLVPNLKVNDNVDKKVLMVEQFWTGSKVIDRSDVNGLKFQIDKLDYITESKTQEEKKAKVEILKNILKDYDYLFILAYDDPFYVVFKELSGISDLHNNTMYKINKNHDDTLSFESVKRSFEDYVVHYYIFGTIHDDMKFIME